MISLTLSVCLSVCLYLSTYYYLSVCRFYLSICPSLFVPSIVTLHGSNFDTNTSVVRSLHLSLCLSFLLSFFVFYLFFFCQFFPCYISLFSLFLSFSFSLSPSTSFHFALKTVTSLDRRDDSLFTLASVLVDLTFTQLLFSR